MYSNQLEKIKHEKDKQLNRWAKKLGFKSLKHLREADKMEQQERRDYKKSQGFNS